MEEGFMKADSANLPRVDAIMVGCYFQSNPDFNSAEFRNVKTSVSSRQSYGDDAIGYVQLRRESNLCTVKCRICPEHKVRSKSYTVTMIVDEKESVVGSVKCHDCAASEGGCKHAVAFLMWVHRRSEEPSCTSIECYWRKAKLAKVGSTLKFITTKELSRKKTIPYSNTAGNNELGQLVFADFLEKGKRRKVDCQILKHQPDYEISDVKMLSMHNLILRYYDECSDDSAKFLECISHIFTDSIIQKIEKETRDQYKSGLWHELRYGRITASKAFDVSRCTTTAGSLVATVMGARIPDTTAMRHGRNLEDDVRSIVEKKLKKKIKKCGLFISKKFPMIAASPHGICEDTIIEMKCPSTEETLKNYIKDDNITKKYLVQIQAQMFASNLKKCYFCVADPNFEINKNVNILLVEYDDVYINDILSVVVLFWKNNIYPLLHTSSNKLP